MKSMTLLANRPSEASQITPVSLPTLSPLVATSNTSREPLRHILLGSPAAVRQTIHLLHTLHYAETILWSPVVTTEEPLIITPAQGEAISLLRKYL